MLWTSAGVWLARAKPKAARRGRGSELAASKTLEIFRKRPTRRWRGGGVYASAARHRRDGIGVEGPNPNRSAGRHMGMNGGVVVYTRQPPPVNYLPSTPADYTCYRCVFACLCSECSEGSRALFTLFLGRAWRSRGQAARLAEHVVVLVPVEKVIDGPELGDLFRVVYR